MERPHHDALDEIEAVVTDLHEMEDAIKTLKNRVDELVSSLGEKITDKEKLVEAATYVYWMIPEAKSTSIAYALNGDTNVHKIKQVLSTVQVLELHCRSCGVLIEHEFDSRNKLQEALRFYRKNGGRFMPSCKACEKIQQDESSQWWKAQQARLNELRTMSYYLYLQTPEWQERRKRHLKSAGYRCQVCNAYGVQLNVHHRTYERRGAEYYKDLLVLCEHCHTIFHQQGKLAEP